MAKEQFEFRQLFLMKNSPDELNPLTRVMDDINDMGKTVGSYAPCPRVRNE